MDTMPMETLPYTACGPSGKSDEGVANGEETNGTEVTTQKEMNEENGIHLPRPEVLDGLAPIDPKEQRKLLPKKKAKAKKNGDKVTPEKETKAAKAKSVAKAKPSAKRSARATSSKASSSDKGPEPSRPSQSRKRTPKTDPAVAGSGGDSHDGADAGAGTSKGKVAKQDKDKVKTKKDTVKTKNDKVTRTKKGKDTNSDKDSNKDLKKKLYSMKSSAYHVAKKAALKDGKTLEEATVLAKQVPWLFLENGFHLSIYIIYIYIIVIIMIVAIAPYRPFLYGISKPTTIQVLTSL